VLGPHELRAVLPKHRHVARDADVEVVAGQRRAAGEHVAELGGVAAVLQRQAAARPGRGGAGPRLLCSARVGTRGCLLRARGRVERVRLDAHAVHEVVGVHGCPFVQPVLPNCFNSAATRNAVRKTGELASKKCHLHSPLVLEI